MATRNLAEVATGAAVLVLALGFLGYAVGHTGTGGGGGGYSLKAKFSDITGLGIGADVRIGGVKVGSVVATGLDPKTYQAMITLRVHDDVKIPDDSSAVVSSDGLLGGKYLALQPGGDTKTLAQDGEITATQGSISIESLLGKFIFSSAGGSGAKPAPAPAPAPSAASGAAPSP